MATRCNKIYASMASEYTIAFRFPITVPVSGSPIDLFVSHLIASYP